MSTVFINTTYATPTPQPKPPHSTVPPNTLHLAHISDYGAETQGTVAWSINNQFPSVQPIQPATTQEKQPQWLNQPAPIGSVWKLFMHIYLVGRERSVPVYICTGRAADRQAEQYCCDHAGERVDRVRALAQSCGAYFQPQRVGVSLDDWRRFWRGVGAGSVAGQDAAWLVDTIPNADTQASPQQILTVLTVVPRALRQSASEDLLAAHITARSITALPVWGGAWRIKTFTWQAQDGVYTGGGAGWLADGTVVWFAGRGSSGAVIKQWANALHEKVYTQRVANIDATDFQQLLQQSGDCVRVRHFAAYPLRRVEGGGATAPKQQHNTTTTHVTRATKAHRRLQSKPYTAHFRNGNRFRFHGSSQQWSETSANQSLQLWGEYSMAEYVARVIDREGNAKYPAAAQALGILARSYVQQFAQRDASCYIIDDSSAHQRVSASPPSAGAAAAALWSAGLVVSGVVPQYRRSATATERTPEGLRFLSWEQAVQQAKAGVNALAILRHTWPALEIAGLHGGSTCQPQPNLQHWLQQQAPQWHTALRSQAGYERPDQVQVCTLTLGNPHADMQRNRIYIQRHASRLLPQHIRLGLLHEYLHLAFKHHPRGLDEYFIESTARKLHRTAWRSGVP